MSNHNIIQFGPYFIFKHEVVGVWVVGDDQAIEIPILNMGKVLVKPCNIGVKIQLKSGKEFTVFGIKKDASVDLEAWAKKFLAEVLDAVWGY